MLIDSPRLKPGDREHWDRLERYDARLGPAVERRAPSAIADIERWWRDGPGVCSVSWGKDSTASADLTVRTGLPIPLVWVRTDPFEMPECEQVRDAFLRLHPDIRYEERVVWPRNPKRGEPGYEEHHLNPDSHSQNVLGEQIPERYISGVRAEESRIRAISIGHRGNVTRNTCRPIARWQATDVFAYLYDRGIPVHPAYAMTYAGVLDRRWIRVHPLCSGPRPQSAVYTHDTTSWEDDYYGTVIASALHARRAAREETLHPDSRLGGPI